MTLNLDDILRSKFHYRRKLAAQPVADKLRLLDQLRQRSLDFAASRNQKASAMYAPELKANSDEMKVKIAD